MVRYDKYKVTAWSRMENNDDKVTLYIPWAQLEDQVALLLDNCMIVKIDGGVREEGEK